MLLCYTGCDPPVGAHRREPDGAPTSPGKRDGRPQPRPDEGTHDRDEDRAPARPRAALRRAAARGLGREEGPRPRDHDRDRSTVSTRSRAPQGRSAARSSARAAAGSSWCFCPFDRKQRDRARPRGGEGAARALRPRGARVADMDRATGGRGEPGSVSARASHSSSGRRNAPRGRPDLEVRLRRHGLPDAGRDRPVQRPARARARARSRGRASSRSRASIRRSSSPARRRSRPAQIPSPVGARAMVDSIDPLNWRRTAAAIVREAPDVAALQVLDPLLRALLRDDRAQACKRVPARRRSDLRQRDPARAQRPFDRRAHALHAERRRCVRRDVQERAGRPASLPARRAGAARPPSALHALRRADGARRGTPRSAGMHGARAPLLRLHPPLQGTRPPPARDA